MNLIKIPSKKYAKQSLLTLYGINHSTANKIIGIFRLHPRALDTYLRRKRLASLVNDTLTSLRINFRLRLIIFSRICLLIATSTYRGLRMVQGLPTRGQRTHANGKTLKKLKISGKFFPFKLKIRKKIEKIQKKSLKNKKIIQQKQKQKLTSKQKAKQKAKNKAKVKAKKKKR